MRRVILEAMATQRMDDSDSETDSSLFPMTLPLIVLGDCYHFPGCDMPLRIFDETYQSMFDRAMETNRMCAVGGTSETGSIFPVVTAGSLRRLGSVQEGPADVIIHGLMRMRVLGLNQLKPYPIIRAEPILSGVVKLEHFEKWQERLADLLEARGEEWDDPFSRIARWVRRMEDPTTICDVVGFHLTKDRQAQRRLLLEENTAERMELLCSCL